MAGWDTAKILSTVSHTMDLATASKSDFIKVADYISDDMTAMNVKAGTKYKTHAGVELDAAQYMHDAYAYALTQSNLNIDALHEAMKYSAPIASEWGLDLGEQLAILMGAADTGIKGSMAGTGMRAGLLRLVAPPKAASKALADMGMSMSDAMKEYHEAQAELQGMNVKVGDFRTTITNLAKALDGLTPGDRLAKINAIFGRNAATYWTKMLSQENIGTFLKRLDELEQGVVGWGADTANVMRDTTLGAFRVLESSMDAVSQSVGNALLPMARAAAEFLSPILTDLSQWIQANPRVIQGIVGIIAGLSALALAVAGVAVAFTAWGFITSQIAMFSAGIAAVRAGMLATEVASLGMAARVGAAYATMSASVTGAIATLRGITWGGLFAGLTAQLAAARVAVASFWASLSAGSIASAVSAALSRVATAIMGVTRAALAFIFSPIGVALMALALAAYVIYQNWDRLVPVFSSVGNAISSALSAAGAAVGNLVSALGTVGEALMNAFKALDNAGGGDVIIRVFLGIVNVLAGVAVSIINIFSSVVNTVAHMFDGLGKAISAALEGEFSQAAGHMKDTLSNIQNDWKDIHFSKLDFGYDIGANYEKSLQIYKNARVTQPVQRATEQPSALSQVAQYVAQPTPAPTESAPAPAPAQAPIDTSPVQNAVNNVAQSTNGIVQSQDLVAQAQQAYAQQQTAAAQTQQTAQQQTSQAFQATAETIQNFPQALQPVQESLANFPQAIEPATTALQNVATSIEPVNAGFTTLTSSVTAETTATTAHTAALTANTAQITASSAALQAFIAALQATLGALQAFTAALMSTIGGLTALASSSSSAASAVSSLGTAASSAASAMSSAASSIASAASSAASAAASASAAAASAGAAKPAANYKGGIYDKGAFLTWFAEKSPEAAIPLDKSQRAINLWTQAGQMLGVLPNDSPINLPADKPQAGSTLREVTSIQREKIKQAQKVYETAVKQQSSTSKILTERQRYGTAEKLERQLEKVTELQTRVQNLQGSQIVNSRSYQAIKNAQQNSTYTRSSILNAPAQYDLPTDRYQNLSIGGFNLRDIPFIGKIFDKANDSIRGIFGKQPVDVFNGIGRNVDYDIMHPTGTFPTLPSENKSQGSLPTDIFKNIGGIDLGNIPIIGGLIDKANGALRGIFGKNPVDIFSGIQQKVDFDIMHPAETFPNLSPMASTLPTLEPTNISPLEEVVPSASTSNYSAETFQPTFNITVNVTGGGENIDTQKIGEQIAFSALESFEKEYNNFMREKSRRGFA